MHLISLWLFSALFLWTIARMLTSRFSHLVISKGRYELEAHLRKEYLSARAKQRGELVSAHKTHPKELLGWGKSWTLWRSQATKRAVQALSQPWCGESTTLIQWISKQDQGKSPAKPDLQHKDSQLSHRIPQSHQLLPSLRAPHCLLTYESGLASAGRQSAEQSTLKK